MKESKHAATLRALDELVARGIFKYDVVQPSSIAQQAKTFVQRCVVGEPGLTYKVCSCEPSGRLVLLCLRYATLFALQYLNLRVFVYPWSDESDTAMKQLCFLNEQLRVRSEAFIGEHGESAPMLQGSANFNITLLNLMQPMGESEGQRAPFPGLGRAVVNWHQDTSLQVCAVPRGCSRRG